MAKHVFGDSGDAYDACQCDEGIKNGDTLDIESEGVIGLAWAWPVAVTAEMGKLHTITPSAGAVDRIAADAKWTPEQIAEAVALATERGYPISEAFADYAPAAPRP